MRALLAAAALGARACLPPPTQPPRLRGHLIAKIKTLHRFPDRDASRYASLVPAPRPSFDGERWLVVKNGTWPNAAGRSTLVVFRGCDAKLRAPRGGSCVRDGAVVARGPRDLHNYALAFRPGSSTDAANATTTTGRDGSLRDAPRSGTASLWGVTGLTSPHHPRTSALVARGHNVQDGNWLRRNHTKIPALRFDQPGCVERRPRWP